MNELHHLLETHGLIVLRRELSDAWTPLPFRVEVLGSPEKVIGEVFAQGSTVDAEMITRLANDHGALVLARHTGGSRELGEAEFKPSPFVVIGELHRPVAGSEIGAGATPIAALANAYAVDTTRDFPRVTVLEAERGELRAAVELAKSKGWATSARPKTTPVLTAGDVIQACNDVIEACDNFLHGDDESGAAGLAFQASAHLGLSVGDRTGWPHLATLQAMGRLAWAIRWAERGIGKECQVSLERELEALRALAVPA